MLTVSLNQYIFLLPINRTVYILKNSKINIYNSNNKEHNLVKKVKVKIKGVHPVSSYVYQGNEIVSKIRNGNEQKVNKVHQCNSDPAARFREEVEKDIKNASFTFKELNMASSENINTSDSIDEKQSNTEEEKTTKNDSDVEAKPSSSSSKQASLDKDEKLSRQSSTSSAKNDDNAVEMIRKYMAEKLGFSDAKKSSESKKKVLEEVSIDGIVKYMKSDACNNIVVMAGAGISTSAGLPDFRSPGSGLYDNLAKYKLPDPQAIFEINFFKENPEPFFALAKELFPGAYKPTPAHYFIKLLHQKGLLLRHYTQNIDGLERVAGVPEDKIVEAHGTFHVSHCLSCHKEYTVDWMKEKIFADEIPKCTLCQGLVKPDIVFFGENLPSKFSKLASADFPKADLLIIMGSSLVVQPFASMTDRVKSTCPRLLLNREKAGERDRLMSLLGMGGGMDFDSDKNYRDVAFLGDCDTLCRQVVEKLGWEAEYEEIMKTAS